MMEKAMEALDDLRRIMRRLRDPVNGCPWDREQDFSSIAPYTVEEAYEVADAIDRNDLKGLRDELGDLLLQVVFHSQMAEEGGHFSLEEVIEGICEKMVRRHPHVFSEGDASDSAAVKRRWNEIKAEERAQNGEKDESALAGISTGLPEWIRAMKLQKRAAAVGFDWASNTDVLEKVDEEVAELKDANAQGKQRLSEELGDLLFVLCNYARKADVDPGSTLRLANAKFECRFRKMESYAKEGGARLENLSLEAMEALWTKAKQSERE